VITNSSSNDHQSDTFLLQNFVITDLSPKDHQSICDHYFLV